MTKKGMLDKLMKDEGYPDLESLLRESLFGMSCPGICGSCHETTYDIEPDSHNGYCESCGENAVVSCQELAFATIA